MTTTGPIPPIRNLVTLRKQMNDLLSLVAGISVGSGVPTGGANGNYYFRTDTPGTANQRVYVKSAGSWVGIV